ncbi:hypothetical protein TNCV_2434291 [Trichonephila clavipes]|nr:hypothetical protein TNCV_2434291 [Trichonephila clavipes]
MDDILTPIVLPMLSSRPGAIYQQDNSTYCATLPTMFKDMTSYSWPARSPDLSPIERLGKATAAVPRYRRINCADAKDCSSTGGHKD